MRSAIKTPLVRGAARAVAFIPILLLLLQTPAHAATVVISEFMASNSKTLADEDGEFSDWIELQNLTTNSVNLQDWSLTDSAADPGLWRFPPTNLPPSGTILVFASSKDRRLAGKQLHTNFKLDGGGEYLALVHSNGIVASEYSPKYPAQSPDVSYGLMSGTATNFLVSPGSVGRFAIPADDNSQDTWILKGFPDSAWAVATNGVGYDSLDTEISPAGAAVLESQPVAYWRLDDSGAVATNVGSLGATIAGSYLGPVTTGQTGPRAPSFLGFESNNLAVGFPVAGGSVAVPYHPSIQSTRFSAECWAYVTGGSGAYRPAISTVESVASRGFWLGANAANRWACQIATPSGWLTMSGVPVAINRWVHLALSCDANRAALYVDGQLVQSTNAILAPGTGGLRIGTGEISGIGGDHYFSGALDEVALFDRPLADDEIRRHYHVAVGAVTTTNTGPGSIAAVQPQAWYRLNETTGPAFANAGSLGAAVSGYHSNGVVLGSAGVRPPAFSGFEASNPAASFDGANDQSIVPFSTALNTNGPFSFGLWVKPTAFMTNGDYRCVVSSSYRSGTARFGWYLYHADGGGGAQIWQLYLGGGTAGNAAGCVGSGPVPGSWNFVVGVYDGVNGVIYQNGLVAGTAVLARPYAANTNVGSPLSIGARSDGQRFFSGSIDEVFLVPRALGATEVAQMYASATNASSVVESHVSYTNLICTDLSASMRNRAPGVYLRYPFIVENPDDFSSLFLRTCYDDGFVAYLNGHEIARDNAPEAVGWQSTAARLRVRPLAVKPETTDVTSARGWLEPGTNVLALHGLNLSASNADFLLSCELTSNRDTSALQLRRYFLSPTPGAKNLAGTTDLGPIISAVGSQPALPLQPVSGQPILVTARVDAALSPLSGVVLNWRVMFGPLNATPMLDDGLNGDAAAGDGIYSAMVPGGSASAGQMLRWYVTSTDKADRITRWPVFASAADSEEFAGTVVADTSLQTALPLLQTFIENTAAADARTGTRCSLFYNGEFYDNVLISLHGQSSSGWAKKPYNLDFSRDHRFRYTSADNRVKDAKLLSNWGDKSKTHNALSHEYLAKIGSASHWCFQVRVQRNGTFFSIADLMEDADDRWLERLRRDPEGALYKVYDNLSGTGGSEKKTRLTEDRSDLNTLITSLSETLSLAQRATYVWDNLDLPQAVSYFAGLALISSQDHGHKNFFVYRDSNASGEWAIFPWDTDLTWGRDWTDSQGYFTDTLYLNNALNFYPGATVQNKGSNRLYNVIFEHPDFRRMYLRRLRTVMDEVLQPAGTPTSSGKIEQRVLQMVDMMDPPLVTTSDADLDYNRWGSWGNMYNMRTEALRINSIYLPGRRIWLNSASALLNGEAIPSSQPSNLVFQVAAVDFNPASRNQLEEYICLSNCQPYAVDISGWKIKGAADFEFKPGTVVPASRSIYVSPDVRSFRTRTNPPHVGMNLYVTGPYQGQLSARGEAISLHDHFGRLVLTNAYQGNPSDVQKYLRITELMYNPDAQPGSLYDAQEYEFIELKNVSTNLSLNLQGTRLTNAVNFNFLDPLMLAPGSTVLLAKNPSAFTARYGTGKTLLGPYSGYLANSGDRIILLDAYNEEVLDFSYSDSWYPVTDGLGFSLVTVADDADPDLWRSEVQWRASGTYQGSPGGGDTPVFDSTIVISEVLSHTDPPQFDSIELHNFGAQPVNISGWFVSDDFFTPKKYRVPNGTLLSPGAYLVLDERQFAAQSDPDKNFRLSSTGDDVWIFSADAQTNLTGYCNGQRFGAARNGVSFGRWITSTGREDFVPERHLTLGTNNAGPSVGPVVISAIMFHPPDIWSNGLAMDDQDSEYLELRNNSLAPVALYDPVYATNGWRLSGAVDFLLPQGTSIPGDGRILLVGFDPANTPRLQAFRTKWPFSTNLTVLGPWIGKLDNSSDDVRLELPDIPNIDGTIPYVLVDRVRYEDKLPWLPGADGTGAALLRRNLQEYGDDPVNWSVVPPIGAQMPDSDNDGMPDYWEIVHGLDYLLADGHLDADGDHMSNAQEWLCRTNPRDPSSALRLFATPSGSGQALLSFHAVAGLSYTVQTADFSGGWATLRQVDPSSENRWWTVTNSVGDARLFRLVTPGLP